MVGLTSDNIVADLELRASVLEEHLKVLLVPLTGLGRRLEGVGHAAERVVAGGRCVASSVRLATGLAPDEGIDELGTGIGGRADTEAGAVNVAPVAPFLAEASDGVTTIRLV